MQRILIIVAVALAAVALIVPAASAGSGNGYGYVWLRDDDGDGIPNGQDPDWIRPEDGTGYQMKYGFGPFIATPLFTMGPAGNIFSYAYLYQNRIRDRKHDGEGTPAGDLLRLRLRLRDGSCD